MASITFRYRSAVAAELPPVRQRNLSQKVSQLRRDLRASVGDGIAWGGMVGLGETYLPAFALAIGLGELTAGLVASLPLLAGGIMQMITPVGIRF